VTIGETPVALFQPESGPQTAEGQPLMVDLPRSGKLLIHFTATADFSEATDKRGGTQAVYRFVLLVDDQPIQPTIPAIEVVPVMGGSAISATAMPLLTAGIHRIQVVAQVTAGAIEATRNQALTAMGVLE
jgi:hypothetical protein